MCSVLSLLNPHDVAENRNGWSNRCVCCAELANTTNGNGSKTTSDGKTFKDTSSSHTFSRRGTPSSQKVGPYDLSCIRENVTKKSLSTDSQDIILASWRKGTSKEYHTYIKKWTEFCSNRNTLPRGLHRSGY